MPLRSGLLDSRLVRRRSLEISRLPSPYAKSVGAKLNYHAPGGPINYALIAPLRQSFRASMQRDSTAGSGKRRLLVALLDADDQWYSAKIRRQVTVLGSRPDCCLVYMARQFWDTCFSPRLQVPGVSAT